MKKYIENYKIKQRRYHYIFSEQPKSGTLMTPSSNTDKVWSGRSSRPLQEGMQNGSDTLEDGLVVSCKAEHTLTMWSNIRAPEVHPTQLKTYVHTETYT